MTASEVSEGKGPGMQILNTGKLRIVFATFIGGMTVACNAAGTSESDAQALQSRLRKSDWQCTCAPQSSTEKRCDPSEDGVRRVEQAQALRDSSESDESGDNSIGQTTIVNWPRYDRKKEIKVSAKDLPAYRAVYPDSLDCRNTSSALINPRGPRAGAAGEQTFMDSSTLKKCSSIARQAVWSQSFANKSENYCIEDKTLTSTDPKAPWYGKTGAALSAVQNRIVTDGTNGSKSKGNKYACQCQREEGCILLIRPDPLAKGQSMFMDEYGAFFFENHQQLVSWGFCKKHL